MTENKTKSIFRKWWVWGLAVVLLFAIIGSFGDSEPAQTNPTTPAQSADPAQEVEILEPTTLDWNKEDLNAWTNGNIDVAVNYLLESGDEYFQVTPSNEPISTIVKRPWDY